MDIMYEVSSEFKRQGAAAELVRAALLGLRVGFSDVVEEEMAGTHRISVFFPRRVSADRLAADLKGFKMKGVRTMVRVHRRCEWETRWKESWKAFALTPSIHVIPLFLPDARCPKGKRPLHLDTTCAFGTGLHETTRFTAQIIETLQGCFKTGLDIGTGTGILAAVMCMNGAEYVEAFDIDPGAVDAARRNLKINGFKCPRLHVCDVQRYAPARSFDLVVANLITHDLTAFKRKIIACVRSGGYLVISGISLKNMPLVKRAYGAAVGLKRLKVVQGKEWAAFLFQKGRYGP